MRCAGCREMMRHGWVITMVGAFGNTYTAPLCDSCIVRLTGAGGHRKLQNLCLEAGWTQDPLPGYEGLMGRPA